MNDGVKSPGSAIAMPAKGGNPDLSRDNLKALLNYIRKEFSK